MPDTVLVILRFLEYAGAAVLFGSSLLLLYGRVLPAERPGDHTWTKPLLVAAASTLLAATVLGFIVQTANLAGSFALALQPDTVKSVLWQMDFGTSSLARTAMAGSALLAAMVVPAGRHQWSMCMALGALICASFAWMGHGAATEGTLGLIHLAGDIAHMLAAAGWIGALVVFAIVLFRPPSAAAGQIALCTSLEWFSGLGSVLVAFVVASGLINSAFLTGWDIPRILSTTYGQVLAFKLALFVLMLALAAFNRFRYTPALEKALQEGRSAAVILIDLRRSVLVEAAVAAVVLAVVAWLGMLAPVTAR